jgi:hypothetical protein
MNIPLRAILPVLRINHAFLVPLILFSIPSAALFQQQILLVAIITIVGLGGMLTTTPGAATAASVSLLALIVWGKVASDLYGLPGPDSALLLLQFMLVILLMEASKAELVMDSNFKRLKGRDDALSERARMQVVEWTKSQLVNLGKLTTAAFFLSLVLLVLGSLASVSINQIAFTGGLVIAAVVALLILLVYRREPEEHGKTVKA